MTIESVKMLKTVQADRECWEAGEIFPKNPGEPLHPILLAEISAGTGTVEVLTHTKESASEKSGLTKPLSDNSLAAAQHREREALEALRLEKEKADNLLIEKREMQKTIEDLLTRFDALNMTVLSVQGEVQELKEVPDYSDEMIQGQIKSLFGRIDALEGKETVVKKEDAPSKKTSGEKVSGKKKIIVRRR